MLLSSGILHRVVCYKLTDVSPVFTASIIRARLHDATFQTTVILIRSENLKFHVKIQFTNRRFIC